MAQMFAFQGLAPTIIFAGAILVLLSMHEIVINVSEKQFDNSINSLCWFCAKFVK